MSEYETKNSHVYIMKPVHANVYKIGETVSLENRIAKLQKKFSFKLEYVGFSVLMEDGFSAEDFLHRKYERFHLGGDWFALDENALNEILQMFKTWESK